MAKPNNPRGNAGKGRPKGSKNKTTVLAKEAIMLVADGLGGTDRMIAWAKEDPVNERIFWGTIYPKLIGIDVSLDHKLKVSGALKWQPTQ